MMSENTISGTQRKKILILTADAGFGHRTAAIAVADALGRNYPECHVVISNPLEYEQTPAFLRKQQSDYDRIVLGLPDLYKFGYQASDASVPAAIMERALTILLYDAIRTALKRYQPDVIVTTYPLYQAPLSAVFSIQRKSVPLLTVVTDLGTVHRIWFHEGADICFVPNQAVKDLALEAGLQEEKIRITGIPVNPQFSDLPADKREIRRLLGWDEERITLLAVGSKRAPNLNQMLNCVNHSRLPLQLALVAGGYDPLYEEFQNTKWHLPVHLYNFTREMPLLMGAADCALGKAGGLFVTEAMACGLPLVIVDVLPGQEEENASFVIDGEAGELADTPEKVLEVLFHWLEDDAALLEERKKRARLLGRPLAAFEIAAAAWQAAQHGPVTMAESRLLGRAGLVDLLGRYGVKTGEGSSGDTENIETPGD